MLKLTKKHAPIFIDVCRKSSPMISSEETIRTQCLFQKFKDVFISSPARNGENYYVLINNSTNRQFNFAQIDDFKNQKIYYMILIDCKNLNLFEVKNVQEVKIEDIIWNFFPSNKMGILLDIEEMNLKMTIFCNHFKSINLNSWVRARKL